MKYTLIWLSIHSMYLAGFDLKDHSSTVSLILHNV
jgi:hypothetical protein